MEDKQIYKTPSKTLATMQVVHLGKILFNLQFIVLALMLASVISFILPALYYIVLFCIAFISLGSLLIDETFRSMWAGGDTLTKIAEVLTHSWKYTVPIVAILAIASIVCLMLDKNKKHVAKIVTSVIICVIALVILVLKLINTGVFA